jgi:hypothetical protein
MSLGKQAKALSRGQVEAVLGLSPWESLVIHQVSRAISLALKPALLDRRKIKRFLSGRRVLAKYIGRAIHLQDKVPDLPLLG